MTAQKKPDVLKKLRQIIQEEVRAAIRAELTPILLEVVKAQAAAPKVPVYEQAKPVKPVQQAKPVKKPAPYVQTFNPATNPAAALLNETMQSMLQEGMQSDPEYQAIMEANEEYIPQYGPSFEQVGTGATVQDMLRTAGKSTKEEMATVSVVPDYTEFMKRLV